MNLSAITGGFGLKWLIRTSLILSKLQPDGASGAVSSLKLRMFWRLIHSMRMFWRLIHSINVLPSFRPPLHWR